MVDSSLTRTEAHNDHWSNPNDLRLLTVVVNDQDVVFTKGFMANHLHAVKAFGDQVLHSMFGSFAHFLQKMDNEAKRDSPL